MPNSSEDRKEKFLTRRAVLRALAPVALAAATTKAARAATGTVNRQVARFQPTPNGRQRCGNCIYREGSECKVVIGVMSDNSWCRFYRAP